MVAVSEPYWWGAAEDEAMQDEHGFLWRALLDTIDIDLAGRRVLDGGCNRGGPGLASTPAGAMQRPIGR